MFAAARRHYVDSLASLGHLPLLWPAAYAQHRLVWLAALGAIAALSLFAWLGNLRRYRAIADTPTSRVATAAQGYVELHGRAKGVPGQQVYTPGTQLPCLWYRYSAHERRGDKWVVVERGESDAEFLLDDGSGQCHIRPEEAEVRSDRKDTYMRDARRYDVESLLAGDPLHALGEFVSQSGDAGFDARLELSDLLSDWKADPADLRRRFDGDGNGVLDSAEWAGAVREAQGEVAERLRAARARPARHVLLRPRHGKPCLIANHPPEAVARRYRRWAWGHAGIALAALAATLFVPA